MQRLISEITRLYLLDGQTCIDQGGANRLVPLSTAIFEQHLLGAKTIAIDLVSDQGTTRALVLDFEATDASKGEPRWRELCVIANALQEQLKLPAPAVSISGGTGYALWLSLESPVPAADAREFLQLLRRAYLPDTASGDASRKRVEPPPCRQVNGKWAAFIHPSMGGSFAEDTALEMAPPLGAQVGFLEGLQSMTVARFTQALDTLRQGQTPVVPAAAAGAAIPSGLLLKDASLEDIVKHLHSKNIEPTFRHIKER